MFREIFNFLLSFSFQDLTGYGYANAPKNINLRTLSARRL